MTVLRLKLWGCAGSAGVVSRGDISKVVFANSAVQLAPGALAAVEPILAAENLNAPQTTVFAPIRYDIVPDDSVCKESVGTAFNLLYREGSGHVLANLIQVDRKSGDETTLLTFDSNQPKFKSGNYFQEHGTEYGYCYLEFDFEANAYHMEVVLSQTGCPGTLTEYPPAISFLQLVCGP